MLYLVAIFSTAGVRVNTSKSVLERAQPLWFTERCFGGYQYATSVTCMGSMLQNAMNRSDKTDLRKTAYRYRPAQDSLPLQTCIRQLTVQTCTRQLTVTDVHKIAYRYRPAQDSLPLQNCIRQLPLQTCIRQLTVTDLYKTA